MVESCSYNVRIMVGIVVIGWNASQFKVKWGRSLPLWNFVDNTFDRAHASLSMGVGKYACSIKNIAHRTHIAKCSKGNDKGIDNGKNMNVKHDAPMWKMSSRWSVIYWGVRGTTLYSFSYWLRWCGWLLKWATI